MIEKYFEKEMIISSLSKYETYFQIALGKYIADFNTQQIQNDFQLEYSLGSIYEVTKELENIKEYDFDNELKKQACMDALQLFVNENLELVKSGSIELESLVNSINDNLFFNDTMNEIFEENLKYQEEKYKAIITQEVANSILESLKNLEQ